MSDNYPIDRFPRLRIDALNVTMQARLTWKLAVIEQTEPAIGSMIPEFESESFETPTIGVIQNRGSQDLVSTQADTA